jgi:hypothetical protein
MGGKDKREVERTKVTTGQVWRARHASERKQVVKVIALVDRYQNRAMSEYARVEVPCAQAAIGFRVALIRIDRLRKDYELTP